MNTLPVSPAKRISNRCRRHAKPPTQRTQPKFRMSVDVSLPNEANIFFRESRAVHILADRLKSGMHGPRRHTAFAYGIGHVVGTSPKEKMHGVNAPTVIAFVADHQPIGDRPDKQLEGESIDENLLTSGEALSQFEGGPISVFRSLPFPAFMVGTDRDIPEKPHGRRQIRTNIHGSHYTADGIRG